MNYCKDYCEEKGISTSHLNDAQKTLYHIAENMRLGKSISEEGYKHFQMAIKALEQEQNGDCISRQGALEPYKTLDDNDTISVWMIRKNIEETPSVTPQQKMGRWIRVDSEKVRCSECDVIHLIAQYPLAKIDWCPNCGTKMESEVEE